MDLREAALRHSRTDRDRIERERAAGSTPGTAGGRASAPPVSGGGDLAPQLADWFAGYRTERAYMHIVQVAAGLTFTAGLTPVFGLRVFDLQDDAALVGVTVQLLPTDSDSGVRPGAASPVDWGDVTGSSAAVVVGRGLGLTEGSWTGVGLAIPGIEYGEAAPPALTLGSAGNGGPLDYDFYTHFPPGKFSDTPPSLLDRYYNLAPMCRRYSAGDKCHVGLAVRSGQIAGLAGASQIVGRAEIKLHFVGTRDLDQWRA